MPASLLRLSPLLLVAALAACDDAPRFTQAEPGEALSAGKATVQRSDRNAFSCPRPISRQSGAWTSVSATVSFATLGDRPSTTTARDGLGPLFNTNACQNCHVRDGRGHPPEPNASNAVSMLVRLSIPDQAQYAKEIERLGVVPEPVYGTQLQDMAVPGVAPEGKVRVDYTSETVTFEDGHVVELRRPALQITQLGYGPMHPDTRFSARVAPPMIGLGLLEAIPEAAILANADPDDRNGDGIRGRPNRSGTRRRTRPCSAASAGKPGSPT